MGAPTVRVLYLITRKQSIELVPPVEEPGHSIDRPRSYGELFYFIVSVKFLRFCHIMTI